MRIGLCRRRGELVHGLGPVWRGVLVAFPLACACLAVVASPTAGAETPFGAPRAVSRPPADERWPVPAPGAEAATDTAEPAEAPGSKAAEAPPPPADPCDASYLDRDAWIDRVHRRVFRTTCESALWFDNLFTSERLYEERDVTQGRVRLGAQWDEREGVDPITRFRIQYRLPQFRRRINAIVGRDDERQLISDRGTIAGERLPVFFGDPDEDEWLLGLGYNPMRGARSRFDTGVGVRLGLPSEPYVNVSYRYHDIPREKRLIRWRQTVFWESEDGLGTTSRIDIERIIGPTRLIRWHNAGTVSEDTQGVDWLTGITLYQKVGFNRAIAYQVGAYGETDAEVKIRDVGLRLIYRQPVFREWLFLDLRPGIAWRKKRENEIRKPLWGFGVALEMRFGKRLREWSGE